jgi:hypothetical protein
MEQCSDGEWMTVAEHQAIVDHMASEIALREDNIAQLEQSRNDYKRWLTEAEENRDYLEAVVTVLSLLLLGAGLAIGSLL